MDITLSDFSALFGDKTSTLSKPPEKINFSKQIDQINDKFIFRKLHAELIYKNYLF